MHLQLADREAMDAAAKAFVDASRAEHLQSHAVNLVERQMALLPTPRSASEYLLRQQVFASTAVMGELQYYARSRSAARFMAAYAKQLGEEGRTDEARALLHHVRRIAC